MPKRRITPKRAAQIKMWQALGARSRRRHSYSNPISPERAAAGKHWPAPIPGSFGTVRRHKLGGKAYQKKSAGTTHVSPEAKAILAGKSGFRDQTLAEMGHQGPAKVPRIKSSWRTKTPSKEAQRARALLSGKKSPSQLHGSGTGLSAAFRYKGR